VSRHLAGDPVPGAHHLRWGGHPQAREVLSSPGRADPRRRVPHHPRRRPRRDLREAGGGGVGHGRFHPQALL